MKKFSRTNLISLWNNLSFKRKTQFFFLILLIFVTSFFEVVSVGAIIPFLAVISSPDMISDNENAREIINHIKIFFDLEYSNDPKKIILPLTIIFIFVSIASGVLRTTLVFFTTKLSFAIGADISIKAFYKILYQNYHFHVNNNSSDIINTIITKTNSTVQSIVMPILNLISSFFITFSIIFFLILLNPLISIFTIIFFFSVYLLLVYFSKKYLLHNSEVVAKESTILIRSLQESLGGIKDVIINKSQKYYFKTFASSQNLLINSSRINVFIGQAPRYIMEMLVMVVMASIVYFLSIQKYSLINFIPILGAIAYGSQKLMPALHQIYNSYSKLKGSQASFEDVLNILDKSIPKFMIDENLKKISFENSIELKNLDFYYRDGNKLNIKILNNINLKINKGDVIGLIGETGSGKTTLLNILMMLTFKNKGKFYIDGYSMNKSHSRSWHSKIAHVPQEIHLLDKSIKENIAYGIEKSDIDYVRLKYVSEIAKIHETIENFPKKYETIVGERGTRLSGGQKQRIGIARALYKATDIIFLDEATSALDQNTEHLVLKSIINSINTTIVMITHRTSTLKICNKVLKINKGKIEDKSNLFISKE